MQGPEQNQFTYSYVIDAHPVHSQDYSDNIACFSVWLWISKIVLLSEVQCKCRELIPLSQRHRQTHFTLRASHSTPFKWAGLVKLLSISVRTFNYTFIPKIYMLHNRLCCVCGKCSTVKGLCDLCSTIVEFTVWRWQGKTGFSFLKLHLCVSVYLRIFVNGSPVTSVIW